MSLTAVNLCTNPLPDSQHVHGVGFTVADSPDGGILVTNVLHNGNHPNLQVRPIMKGLAYHFHAEIWKISGSSPCDSLIWTRWGLNCSYVNQDLPASPINIDFTASQDSGDQSNTYNGIGLKGFTDGTVRWYHVGLFTAADWQLMQRYRINWFGGTGPQSIRTDE